MILDTAINVSCLFVCALLTLYQRIVSSPAVAGSKGTQA